MISLDKLRKRSGLLIGGIGIAMGAFLLGDLMNSGTSLFNSAQGVLGEVNDEVIDYREFETDAQNLDRIFNTKQDRNVLRDNLWADKLSEIIMGEEYAELGLSISSEELAGLTFGYKSSEMSATAKQFFGVANQDISSAQLANLIQQIHDNDPLRWMYFENVIRKERLSQKYTGMIRHGLVASNIDAEVYYSEQASQASGRYVFKPFDTNIEVSDADITAYYNANKEDYPQSATRELSLAIFDILPTAGDKNAVKEKITSLIEDKVVFNKNTNSNETVAGFKNTDNAASFVADYSDASFDATFYAEGQLSPAIEAEMRNAEIGHVFGPYEENNSYKIARLNARRSDSVQVAIIEMSIDPSEETSNEIYAQASELAAATDKETLEAMADEKNIAISTARVQDADRSVVGLGDARNLVFWAYNENTTLNSVKLEDLNDRIVVIMLTDIIEEGTQSIDEVKAQIEIAVKREKSGEVISAEFEKHMASTNSIDDLAKAMGLSTEQVTTMAYSTNAIPGGYEPNVVGAFYGIEKGQLSKPVIGNNGVYVVSTDDFKEAVAPENYTDLKKQLEAQLQPRANFEVYNALKENTEIEDNRAKFY